MSSTQFPLCDNKLGWEERGRAAELLLSGRQLSMGPETALLELEFAAYMSAPHSLFVNSGSSANQLAVVAACHPLRTNRLLRGDKVLVPALCWSTTVSPLVLQGLVPVFVDVCPSTLQMCVEHAAELVAADPAIRGLMLVHVMGGCPDMDEVLGLVSSHGLVFIEDACEAMGNTFKGRKLGTFGDFGAFSSFYSHHMTSVEGGFLLTRTDDDHKRCVMLREHGWIRRLAPDVQQAYADENPSLDRRFLFADMGYNFRPTDITAVVGRVQLQKLDGFNANRRHNFVRMRARLADSPGVALPTVVDGAEVAFLALVIIVKEGALEVFKERLEALGVETRPVISGNFVRQPCLTTWGVPLQDLEQFVGAEIVHWHALYIGLHGQAWSDAECDGLASSIRVAASAAGEHLGHPTSSPETY